MDNDDHESRLRRAIDARVKALGHLGAVSPNALVAQIDEGPPFWPAGRAYQHIHRPGRFVIATAGLSNPWEEPGRPGYGYELVMEVAEDLATAPWVFSTIAAVAEASIRPGQQFRQRIDHLGTMSNEVRGDAFPDAWRSHTGRVGVLFGVPIADCPTTFETPDGDVRIVPITILHPTELAAIVVYDGAREQIAAQLASRDRGHASLLDRSPVAAALEHCEPFAPAPKAVPRKPWWKVW